LKIFYHLGKIDGFIGRQDDVDELIKNYPPIELPSDEEVEEETLEETALSFLPHSEVEHDTAFIIGFEFGAIWMRDKIQGGNK
jgi:hypothetical protein